MQEFPFAFDPRARVLLAPLGVRSRTSWVRLDEVNLDVRYGPWRLVTARANVSCVHVTGPYHWVKAIGPRMSLADRGITFGTNARLGLCVRFHAPVPGLVPGPWLKHPAVTLTVVDPHSLAVQLS